jgi:cell division protein FtsI/penicillin-binding protein 2
VKLQKDHIAFGKTSYAAIIRRSCNRAIALMALMLGEQRMCDGARLFGFGSKTGYGLGSESIGHCIAVTLVQMHCAMSVFANGDLPLAAQSFKSVTPDQETILKFSPQIEHGVLSKAIADHMQDIPNNPYYDALKCSMA